MISRATTKMKKIGIFSAFLLLVIAENGSAQVQYISTNLAIKFEVVSNFEGDTMYYTARITLKNNGESPINKNGWELYFTSIYMLAPDGNLPHNADGYVIPGSTFRVYHINGCVFKFVPTQDFNGLTPGNQVVINLKIQNWSVARTDNMPNWWVVDTGDGTNLVIESTATEHLETFTGDYDTSAQWKRYPTDKYDPWTPEERYNRNQVTDLKKSAKLVIPTPKTAESNGQSVIQKPLSDWKIFADTGFENEASLLSGKLSLEIETTQPSTNYIYLIKKTTGSTDAEDYILEVKGNSKIIEISSSGAAGIYYGCQTLISLLETKDTSEIPGMKITDSPRFGYRGMHIDVARHFVPYGDIIKLIQVMGMYKLNKLHFHLTDDEGWRVEMPWCPYLTTVGATQCYDPDEQKCIIPQFGSRSDGTDRGSGFYTKEEYRDILRMAERHHIEVIPEVDMPGHARAAIKATEAYLKANGDAAESIQLSDPGDPSLYLSVQLYTDNAINPCLDSSYTFVQKTVETFVDYHRDIQPLKVMHLGGDEVAHGAWLNSTACEDMIAAGTLEGVSSVDDLGEYFVQRISEVVNGVNNTLALGLWEDGAITRSEEPFNISDIKTPQVVVNAWQNIWEWGVAERAYKLANAGYKVVMSQATHLYFDHPEEPDPEERGFYWATRYASTQKTFGFMPEDLYANADTTRAGDPYTEEDVCAEECVQLNKPENIIGMQGLIWTETIRNSNELFHAIFPRLLAMAERAWYKASWETSKSDAEKLADWTDFANTVGYKELERLEDAGVSYRVPVPGAKIDANGRVQLNSEYPGLEIVYSKEPNPRRWMKYTVPFQHNEDSYMQVRSNDDKRSGRIVPLYTERNAAPPVPVHYNVIIVLVCLCFAIFVL